MRLTTELTVEAPLERAWRALLELGGPVSFDLDGPWSGRAHLDDADEDEHTAGFHLLGRQANGPGSAAATITARASDDGDGTRFEVETDLRTTGPGPDPEVAQRSADELLDRLASRLAEPHAAPPEPLAREEPHAAPPEPLAPEEAAPPEPPAPEEPELPPGPELTDPEPEPVSAPVASPSRELQADPVVLGGKVAERALLVVTGIALGLGLGRLLWWRRR